MQKKHSSWFKLFGLFAAVLLLVYGSAKVWEYNYSKDSKYNGQPVSVQQETSDSVTSAGPALPENNKERHGGEGEIPNQFKVYGKNYPSLAPNVKTTFNTNVEMPLIDPYAYIHPYASIIGHVFISKNVLVAPFASIRGDEGQPIVIGEGSNVQDGVVIHAHATESNGENKHQYMVEYQDKEYAVYVGDNVSLAHQAQLHGPVLIEENTFVGMQALVYKSKIGKNTVIEPGAKIIGVKIAAGKYVPAGAVIDSQDKANRLPTISSKYAYYGVNEEVVKVNKELAEGYRAQLEMNSVLGK